MRLISRVLAAAVACLVVAGAAAWLVLGDGSHRDTTASDHVGHAPSVSRSSKTIVTAKPKVITTPASRPFSQAQQSLAQLAGQRVIYAYAGPQPPASLLQAVHAGEAAGVIFFENNIASLPQIHHVLAQLQQASLASPTHAPLLMLVDQEGGEVRRLPGAPLVSEKAIGHSQDPTGSASSAGAGAGARLASVGVNVNLAPVVDVYRAPGNFIDEFQRSYSSDPAVVSSLAAAFIVAEQRAGVAATAKHFPGLGSARQDENTDLRQVTLNTPLATLRSVDESPYRDAISAGVKLVMTSWAVYPALDPNLPAGLSPAVIQGELRRRLGFRGVTITDGIEAGAVTPFGDLATRSIRAAAAGADLILCATTNPDNNTPSVGLAVLHAIATAISAHRLDEDSARREARRILELRKQL